MKVRKKHAHQNEKRKEKGYGHPHTKVSVSNHPDDFNSAGIFWSKTGLLVRNESQHALTQNVEFLMFEQVCIAALWMKSATS